MSNSATLGPRLRLRRLSPAELPAHPELAEQQSGAPDPKAFAGEVLTEAKDFMTSYWPQKFKVKSAAKKSPPSTAPVEVLTKDVTSAEIPQNARLPGAPDTESWFARTSVHVNKRETGTAAWDEFEGYLLDNHSLNEKEYTPNVYDANKVLDWDSSTLAEMPGWEKVEMHIFEMCHVLPAPFQPRTFAVLIVKGRNGGPGSDFITAQIPVDLTKVPQALYANGRNRSDGKTAQQKKETTAGMYVSVERAEQLDDGAKVKWQMATASDAKGNLPMWMQKMGVPGAVVHDVGLFMDWVAKRRGGSTH